MTTDIRWKQQYSNFVAGMDNVRRVLEGIVDPYNLTIIEKLAMLRAFEFSLEMAKKTLKRYLLAQEGKELTTKGAIKEAFKAGLIEDSSWEHIIDFRNSAVHDYDETVLDKSIETIIHQLIPALEELENNLRDISYAEE